jgi:hypothetical protein
LLNRHLARAAYVVGFALILIPMFDAGTSILPLRLGESRWRYGSIGLLSNSLLIPMAGALVVFAVANAFSHRRTLRVLGGIAAVSCLLCVVSILTFALDALQSQVGLRPEVQTAYVVGSATAGIKLLIGAVAFGFFALAGLKPVSGDSSMPAKGRVLIGNLEPTRVKRESASASQPN